ncbi:MAG: hypothetical protein GY953_24215 [bacterium]|nr:hypothetical protein [bacterium]
MASKSALEASLREEVDRWAAKSYQVLRDELQDVVAYEKGHGENCHQFEVQLLEDEDDYVHVGIGVDDGGWRAFAPLSTSFLVYRDGRVDK